jgi:hypothetical protein
MVRIEMDRQAGCFEPGTQATILRDTVTRKVKRTYETEEDGDADPFLSRSRGTSPSSAQGEGRFQEFCFLCSQWFDGLKSSQSHATEHVQSDESTSLLPLKCDVVHFRHNLIRPGLCPECLGDDDAEPQNRFQQHTNVSEWKTHVLRHVASRRHHQWHRRHSRCTKFVEIDTLTEFFHHLADIHQIRFSVTEKEQAAQNLIAVKLAGQVHFKPSEINNIWAGQQGELVPACRTEPASAKEKIIFLELFSDRKDFI